MLLCVNALINDAVKVEQTTEWFYMVGFFFFRSANTVFEATKFITAFLLIPLGSNVHIGEKQML